MKTSFYIAALLGLTTSVTAINLKSNMPTEEFDYTLAEVDAHVDADCECECEAEGEGNSSGLTAADCYQNVGGVLIQLQTPECMNVPPPKPACPPKPCFE